MALSQQVEQELKQKKKKQPKPEESEETQFLDFWDNIRVLAQAWSDGKIGWKEMKYLYIIIAIQLSLVIVDMLSPSASEMQQHWYILFTIVKVLSNVAWILYGGWLKKQVQIIKAANEADKKHYKQEFKEEVRVVKESLNTQSIELERTKLQKEKAEWQAKNLENKLMEMIAEKKKWKAKYYEECGDTG